MSPILVRPVREQLEHDRVIRLLQAKLRRKHEVAINVGAEQTTPVRAGTMTVFPDVVLTSPDRGRRLEGVIEVETGESVNHLEAMAQWAPLGLAKAPFHLYVPAGSVEVARRLCSDYNVQAAEIWSYHLIGDQMRFTMVHRAPAPKPPMRRPALRARATGTRPSANVRSASAARRKTSPRGAAKRVARRSSTSSRKTAASKRK